MCRAARTAARPATRERPAAPPACAYRRHVTRATPAASTRAVRWAPPKPTTTAASARRAPWTPTATAAPASGAPVTRPGGLHLSVTWLYRPPHGEAREKRERGNEGTPRATEHREGTLRERGNEGTPRGTEHREGTLRGAADAAARCPLGSVPAHCKAGLSDVSRSKAAAGPSNRRVGPSPRNSPFGSGRDTYCRRRSVDLGRSDGRTR